GDDTSKLFDQDTKKNQLMGTLLWMLRNYCLEALLTRGIYASLVQLYMIFWFVLLLFSFCRSQELATFL
ncbi:hypothetical protein RYX36_028785, partial [Vicia faba]